MKPNRKEGDDPLISSGVQDRQAPRLVGNRRVMSRVLEAEIDRAPRPSEPRDEDDLG